MPYLVDSGVCILVEVSFYIANFTKHTLQRLIVSKGASSNKVKDFNMEIWRENSTR